jgi:hypothetical protein
MNLLNEWQTIANNNLLDLPGEFSISYRMKQLSGSCPDVHTYHGDFSAVVNIRFGVTEFSILAGSNWLCIEGEPALMSSKGDEPFVRAHNARLEKLFEAILTSYMNLADPDLVADFADEKCGVFFDNGDPTRFYTINDTRH